jgi:DnaJ-class molecular chaperone
MIVTEKMAQEAWDVLRPHTSLGQEDIRTAIGKPDAPEIIQHAYRQAVKVVHPDKGGTAEQFAAVDRAKHVLLAWLEKKAKPTTPGAGTKCQRCAGKGHVELQKAWRTMRVQCPTCRGTGDLDSEFEKGNGRMD